MASLETKDYVSVLRLHGEYLRKLDTELLAELEKLEQALRMQPETSHAVPVSLIDQIAQLQRHLAGEANMFHLRLQAFLEDLKKDADPL